MLLLWFIITQAVSIPQFGYQAVVWLRCACKGRWLSACASEDTWTDELAEIACEELGLPFMEARGTVKQ